MNFYDLEINTPQGTPISMKAFKGKTVLIVNTATKCGLTPQFEGLEKLHQTYKDKGLVIIGTPCNQFLGQEPEANENMEQACQINHGVTFQLTEKIKVNGRQTHPLFKYLKSKLRGGFFSSRIKWNFTKFLIGPDGTPIQRYKPQTVPAKIESDIQAALNQ